MLDAQLRGAFLELIHFAEVAVRDAFHATLSAEYGTDWYRGQRVLLDDRTRDRFTEAERRVTIATATPERVIAEASFGAWTDLLEAGATSSGGNALSGRADYARDLWNGRLEVHFASVNFLGQSTRQQQAAALMRRVGRLRNRVAHHESVVFGVHQPGERDASGRHKRQHPVAALNDVRTLIEAFCAADAAAWLATCTHVDELLAEQLAQDGLTRVKAVLLPRTIWI